MTFKNKKPIVIAGGGPGGLTAALALARKGLSCIVLEQVETFREKGGGIQLCPNVFKMLDVLGIIDAVKEIAIFPDSLSYVDGLTGKEFINVPLGKKIEEQFKYPYAVFYRAEFLNLLVKECQKSSLIQLVHSSYVKDFEQHNDYVTVHVKDSSSYEADALIGADGIWSNVRKQLLGASPPRNSGLKIYRGVVPMDSLPQHIHSNDVVHLVNPHCHFVHYPIGSKRFMNIAAIIESAHFSSIKEDTATKQVVRLEDGDPNEVKKAYKDCCKEIHEFLPFIDTDVRWILYDRDPDAKWSEGRVTLLGDAVHPTLPFMTQGAGMAIEDALVLASKIIAFKGDYPRAFVAYEKERYLRCAFVQYFSRLVGEAHHSSGVARELRNYFVSHLTPQEITLWLAKMYDGIDVD